MLKLIEVEDTDKLWDEKHGDMICMGQYLVPFKAEQVAGCIPLYLGYINLNYIKAAKALMFDLEQFEQYYCPYTDREYDWAVPVAIFTDEMYASYENYVNVMKATKPYMLDAAIDNEWNVRYFPDPDDSIDLDLIESALLGPGYTEGTIVSDGNVSFQHALGTLSDGSKVLFITHLWHNK